eukprot:scaffold1564_cov389-Prasinococcus_capsulatus_cf.AAC.12
MGHVVDWVDLRIADAGCDFLHSNHVAHDMDIKCAHPTTTHRDPIITHETGKLKSAAHCLERGGTFAQPLTYSCAHNLQATSRNRTSLQSRELCKRSVAYTRMTIAAWASMSRKCVSPSYEWYINQQLHELCWFGGCMHAVTSFSGLLLYQALYAVPLKVGCGVGDPHLSASAGANILRITVQPSRVGGSFTGHPDVASAASVSHLEDASPKASMHFQQLLHELVTVTHRMLL